MEKIVYLSQGTGSDLDNLNKLLESGWKVVQMCSMSSDDGGGCFVWIRKE